MTTSDKDTILFQVIIDRGLQYFDQDSKTDQTFKVALTPRLEFIYPEDTIPTAHKKV